MKKRKNNKKILLIIGIIVLAITGVCVFYVKDYYKALPEALVILEEAPERVKVLEEKNKQIVFEVENAKTGFIFYPGGKVQYEAYVPLLSELAEQGIMCVLLHMPANLAVLDMNAADGIIEKYPEIEEWYLGGHSLGGSMAASYVDKHPEEFEGLVLLASYSTADLTDDDLTVISIYGSEDKVLNEQKYEEYRGNISKNLTEVIIEGGNHAYFGTYGMQEGDGEAKITNEEQIQYTSDMILEQIFDK